MNDKTKVSAEEAFEDDPAFVIAREGMDMETFKHSQLGKVFIRRAEAVIDNGFADIVDIDPDDDVKTFRKVQLRIKAAQYALTWIAETIELGESAMLRIEDEELEDE